MRRHMYMYLTGLLVLCGSLLAFGQSASQTTEEEDCQSTEVGCLVFSPAAKMSNTDVKNMIDIALGGQDALSGVMVRVIKNEIILSGSVQSSFDRKAAEQLAQYYAGGRKVNSEMLNVLPSVDF